MAFSRPFGQRALLVVSTEGAENWFRRLLLRPSRWPERQRSTLWISGREREATPRDCDGYSRVG
jgi:hypothetical protein